MVRNAPRKPPWLALALWWVQQSAEFTARLLQKAQQVPSPATYGCSNWCSMAVLVTVSLVRSGDVRFPTRPQNACTTT